MSEISSEHPAQPEAAAAGAAGSRQSAAPEAAFSAEELESRLAALPARPGCYIFRDRRGEVLYVGKAKSLRSRVRSYFQAGSSDDRAFLPFLRSAFGRFETLVTETEKEAAILENSLIKEQRPRFNVKLRDDKEFLTLRLDPQQAWPRLDLVRRPEPDRARYFGPYHSATAARRTLHLVEKHFQLRTCTDRDFESRKRPCLQYQIKRCSGPCVYEVDAGLYEEQVRAVSLFLEGRHDELSRQLAQRMQAASEQLEFELAALYRDQMQAIESVRQQQRVVAITDKDQDVVGLYREGDLVELAVLYVRSGRVIEAATFSQPRVEVPDAEVIASYLRDHYGEEGLDLLIPDEVIVPELPEGAEGVAEWLSERRAASAAKAGRKPRKTQLFCPERGVRRQLLELAQDNARHAFEEKRRAEQDVEERLGRLQARLRLPVLPRHIECIDISHLAGQDTYGSIVALKDGVPNKRDYRSYRVRAAAAGDDYAAIYEVLSRRFLRGQQARRSAAGGGHSEPASGDLTPPAADARALDATELDSPELDAAELDAAGLDSAGLDSGDLDSAGLDSTDLESADLDSADLDSADLDSADLDSADLDSADLDSAALDSIQLGGTDQHISELNAQRERRASARTGEQDTARPAWALPDLLVVDGGRGQLAVALAAAHDLGLRDLSIVGLAKEKENVQGEKLIDRVYLPGQKNPVGLKPNAPELFWLARARDEAHRFANRMRKKAGKRRRLASALDAIPGIGPKTRQLLLKHIGGPEQIRAASDAALLAIPGIGARHVRALRSHLSSPGGRAEAGRSDRERAPSPPESEQSSPSAQRSEEARSSSDPTAGSAVEAIPGALGRCEAPAG